MRTEQRQNLSPAPAEPSVEEPAKNKVDLSLTQVLGGALAAMTAAFLGSRLSVAGTVVGAAVASITAAVAGSLYTASLRTTRERVRTVWQGRVQGSALPTRLESTGSRNLSSTTDAPAQPSAPVAVASSHLNWRTVLIGALAAFALAAVVLTGVELATGSSLSGGGGTTISQVTEPRRSAPQQDATPSAAPSSASPSATATTSPTPSTAPSETSTPAPAPTTSSTEQPTAAPSTTAPAVSPTPEAVPSGTPTPQG
jgi:hypothetical protein